MKSTKVFERANNAVSSNVVDVYSKGSQFLVCLKTNVVHLETNYKEKDKEKSVFIPQIFN